MHVNILSEILMVFKPGLLLLFGDKRERIELVI